MGEHVEHVECGKVAAYMINGVKHRMEMVADYGNYSDASWHGGRLNGMITMAKCLGYEVMYDKDGEAFDVVRAEGVRK